MKKICMLSDSFAIPTGYSTISRNILNRLHDRYGWECHQFAHNFPGATLKPGVKFEDDYEMKFWVHGCSNSPYYKDLIMPKLQKIRPDIFMVLLDTFMLYPWFVELDFAPARSIFYFPSDGGGGLPLGCEIILRKVDCPVAMSKFGKAQVEKLHGIKCEYVPHGVDSKIYYPLTKEQKEQLRLNWMLKDKFVVGVVARNQGRKMLDRTIKIFRLVANEIPEAVLLLHMDANDPAQVFPMAELIKRLHLENRVVFTGINYWNGFDYTKMNEVYNLMDVFLLSTSGEGFGIPIIEAMSCEVPVVATDYTTTKELVLDNKAGEGIDLIGTEEEENDFECANIVMDGVITGSWMVERGLCSIKDGAKKIIKLYKDKSLREQEGKNGRKAVLKEYDWEIVMKEWDRVLNKLTAS